MPDLELHCLFSNSNFEIIQIKSEILKKQFQYFFANQISNHIHHVKTKFRRNQYWFNKSSSLLFKALETRTLKKATLNASTLNSYLNVLTYGFNERRISSEWFHGNLAIWNHRSTLKENGTHFLLNWNHTAHRLPIVKLIHVKHECGLKAMMCLIHWTK